MSQSELEDEERVKAASFCHRQMGNVLFLHVSWFFTFSSGRFLTFLPLPLLCALFVLSLSCLFSRMSLVVKVTVNANGGVLVDCLLIFLRMIYDQAVRVFFGSPSLNWLNRQTALFSVTLKGLYKNMKIKVLLIIILAQDHNR